MDAPDQPPGLVLDEGRSGLHSRYLVWSSLVPASGLLALTLRRPVPDLHLVFSVVAVTAAVAFVAYASWIIGSPEMRRLRAKTIGAALVLALVITNLALGLLGRGQAADPTPWLAGLVPMPILAHLIKRAAAVRAGAALAAALPTIVITVLAL